MTQNKERYQAYLDCFIKSQQVMGKTITPEQQYEFAKYTKASGATLSDRFKITTGVLLAQEMGGATTGVSVDQLVKQVIGIRRRSRSFSLAWRITMTSNRLAPTMTYGTGGDKALVPSLSAKATSRS
jgi:hypothetical protein